MIATAVRTKLGAGGRIVIPRAMRQALGVKPGDELMLRMDADELGDLRVYTLDRAVKRAQRDMRPYARPGVSVVDEFIAERRAEATQEAADAAPPPDSGRPPAGRAADEHRLAAANARSAQDLSKLPRNPAQFKAGRKRERARAHKAR